MIIMSPQKRTDKKKPSTLLGYLFPILLVGCGANEPEKVSNRTVPAKFVNGSFMVRVDQESTADNLQGINDRASALAKDNGCSANAAEKISWETVSGVIPQDLDNTYHLQFKDCELDREASIQIMTDLATVEGVANIEANSFAEATQENDPDLREQYYLSYMNRNKACELAGNRNQKPVVVAVIDSGVDRDHPDLVNAFYRDSSGKVIGANFVGKGARGTPDDSWDDVNGHGTHVAGIIAATANNGVGIAGVAGCANVKIMPIKVLGDIGSGTTLEIERGTRWAAEHGADIINLSLGSNGVSQEKLTTIPNPLYEAINAQGVTVFAAAGNDSLVNGLRNEKGYTYALPASYNNVIAVAATDAEGQISSFSNRGDKIDIAAPGSGIHATYPGGIYKKLSGTSMAAPAAAGAYALALSTVIDANRRGIKHDDAMKLLSTSVMLNPTLNKKMVASGGNVDAYALAQKMMEAYNATPRKPVNDPNEPVVDDQPVNDDPDTDEPVVDQPSTPETGVMTFVNLLPYRQLQGAIPVGLGNLPAGTKRVYLYWGLPGQVLDSFASLEVSGSTAQTAQRFYFLGNKNLYAEALDAQGRQLKVIAMPLKGL